MEIAERRALKLLAGCPSGATEYALIKLHKIPPMTISKLVRDGAVWRREYVNNTIKGKSFPVVWLNISPLGHAMLDAAKISATP